MRFKINCHDSFFKPEKDAKIIEVLKKYHCMFEQAPDSEFDPAENGKRLVIDDSQSFVELETIQNLIDFQKEFNTKVSFEKTNRGEIEIWIGNDY